MGIEEHEQLVCKKKNKLAACAVVSFLQELMEMSQCLGKRG